MRKQTRFILATIIVLSSFALVGHSHALSLFSKSKPIDPPTRVARLSYTQGDVSFSPAAAKNNVWVVGRVNRPLVAGDRLWVDGKSRAELQLGNAAVRMTDNTSLRVINLNDQLAQFDLAQGSFILKIRQIKNGQTYEINTPQLAFRISQTGDYRVDVAGNATTITVRKGNGIAYAKNVAYQINSSQAYRFSGKNLAAQTIAVRSLDSFDKWSTERDTRTVRSKSSKYVSPTMIGYEDLDNYGSWRPTTEYGYVWTPNRVRAGWAPYRYGHWSWIAPWGWTWIDDEPWGFAPSHYGRWAHYHNSWVWIPGSRTVQASYAPALVVFVGGNNHRIVVNEDPAIAWFPLGPRDVYVPPYTTSETYFTSINANNASVTQVQITNVYKNRNTHVTYTNYQINNAITAVPTKTFTQSQPTAKTAVPVTTTVINNAPVTSTATVATPTAPVGTGYQVTTNKPSESTLQQVPVVVAAPETATVPVQQITPVTTTEPVPVVTGTYNGGNDDKAAEQAAVVAKEKAEKEAAEKAATEAAANAERKAAEKAKAAQEKEAAREAAVAAQEETKRQATEAAKTEKEAAQASAAAEREAKENAQAEKAAAEAAANAERKAAEKTEADQAAAQEKEAAREAEKQAAREAEQAAERERAEAVRQEQQAAEAQRAAEHAQAEQAAAAEAQRQAAEAAKAAAEKQAAERAEAERKAAEAAAAQQPAAEQPAQ